MQTQSKLVGYLTKKSLFAAVFWEKALLLVPPAAVNMSSWMLTQRQVTIQAILEADLLSFQIQIKFISEFRWRLEWMWLNLFQRASKVCSVKWVSFQCFCWGVHPAVSALHAEPFTAFLFSSSFSFGIKDLSDILQFAGPFLKSWRSSPCRAKTLTAGTPHIWLPPSLASKRKSTQSPH